MALQVGMPLTFRNGNGIIRPGMVYSLNESDPDVVQKIVWFDEDLTPRVQLINFASRDDTLSSNNTWRPVSIEVQATAKFEGA